MIDDREHLVLLCPALLEEQRLLVDLMIAATDKGQALDDAELDALLGVSPAL